MRLTFTICFFLCGSWAFALAMDSFSGHLQPRDSVLMPREDPKPSEFELLEKIDLSRLKTTENIEAAVGKLRQTFHPNWAKNVRAGVNGDVFADDELWDGVAYLAHRALKLPVPFKYARFERRKTTTQQSPSGDDYPGQYSDESHRSRSDKARGTPREARKPPTHSSSFSYGPDQIPDPISGGHRYMIGEDLYCHKTGERIGYRYMGYDDYYKDHVWSSRLVHKIPIHQCSPGLLAGGYPDDHPPFYDSGAGASYVHSSTSYSGPPGGYPPPPRRGPPRRGPPRHESSGTRRSGSYSSTRVHTF